ncbi:putative quinol monooxygenase [Sphingomonadaceae bacterium G21617-S1]|nr:putative quinol monooxygenase [Sphingomonadaceae bacterium G21617-S1]
MLAITADFTFDEDSAARAEALLKELADAVAHEAGNLRYDVLKLRQTPPVYRLYEVYESADAFEAHKSSDHLRAIFPELRKIMTAPSVIVEYDFIASAAASRTA